MVFDCPQRHKGALPVAITVLAPLLVVTRRVLRALYLGTFFPKRNVGDADMRHVYCGFASKLVNNCV